MHPDLVTRLHRLFSWGSLVVLGWVCVALVVGVGLSWITRRLLARLAKRTTNQWDDELVARLAGPLSVAWALAVAYLGLPWLELSAGTEETARRVLKGSFVATIFWVLLRSIDVADHLIESSHWASQRLSSRSFVALGSKVLKISIVIIGVVMILSQAGYPVGSLLAGLGIGGLALALAAQKTVENVFGAFSIAVDEPFRQGDFVKVDTVMGTVESIGLRSTRIRTLDRTIVAIPNGKLAEMRTESFAARDRLRFACTVALVYDTTAAQMRRVLAEFDADVARPCQDLARHRRGALHRARAFVAEHRGRRLVPHHRLERVPADQAGDSAAVHGDRLGGRHDVRVPHANLASGARGGGAVVGGAEGQRARSPSTDTNTSTNSRTLALRHAPPHPHDRGRGGWSGVHRNGSLFSFQVAK